MAGLAIVGSEYYCLYEGREYVLRNRYMDKDLGERVANILLPENLSSADFPEAVRSGGEGDDRWVVIPERLVSREWAIDVYGEWRGVEFGLSVYKGVLFGYTTDSVQVEQVSAVLVSAGHPVFHGRGET